MTSLGPFELSILHKSYRRISCDIFVFTFMCDDPTFRGKKNRNGQWENFDNKKKKEKKTKKEYRKTNNFFVTLLYYVRNTSSFYCKVFETKHHYCLTH